MTFRYKYTEKRDPHPMQMIADLHTHTLCASHAYQTLQEMAAAAKTAGYCALAITDHAPAMPDAPHSWHFSNGSSLPRQIDGVVMLYGAEANVMDTKGGLDMPQSQLAAQDWVVASIHSPCVPGLLTRKEANRLWLQVAENPYVDCIGHSEQENYRYDYDLVTKAFARSHKVVELNANSFNVRRDGIPNMRELLRACLQNGCRIAVNSDAHSAWKLQTALPPLYALLAEMAFPQELIVNATRQNLVQELKLHGRRCGRRSRRHHTMSQYTIGIDLGGTTMTAGLVNESYEIVGKITWPTKLPRPADDLEKALADLCRAVTKANNVDFSSVKYVGIGTPGSVNFTTGFVGYNTNFGYYD